MWPEKEPEGQVPLKGADSWAELSRSKTCHWTDISGQGAGAGKYVDSCETKLLTAIVS